VASQDEKLTPAEQDFRPARVRVLIAALRREASGLGGFEDRFGRHANGFKPTADIDLRVRFSTEMPGRGAASGRQIPLNDCKLLISALDHKPVDRIVTHDPANFALEFFQTGHAFSVER
jgi:hypothetical protein